MSLVTGRVRKHSAWRRGRPAVGPSPAQRSAEVGRRGRPVNLTEPAAGGPASGDTCRGACGRLCPSAVGGRAEAPGQAAARSAAPAGAAGRSGQALDPDGLPALLSRH